MSPSCLGFEAGFLVYCMERHANHELGFPAGMCCVYLYVVSVPR